MAHRFGDFTLDGHTRRLVRDGTDVHLSPKAFELLSVLVENRARALSKAELLELIWPSTFVEETNLAGLVLEIRRALGDTADTPKLIRTIYGFGYHFIGTIADDTRRTRIAAAPGERCWLEFERRRVPLMEGEQVVGRAPDAGIALDLPGVSRYHARIALTGHEATIEDLGSKNGTRVNGQRVSGRMRLADGDEIRLGEAALTFRRASAVSPTATVIGV